MISEKIIMIKNQLEKGVNQVFESSEYKEYLKCMSKFHKYSFRNVLLIKMQMPEATRVAGTVKWQNEFGRKIKEEEKDKGIILLIPSVYKKNCEREVRLNKNGKIEISLNEVTVPYFKLFTVFDIKQTEGKTITKQNSIEIEDLSLIRKIETIISENCFTQINREIFSIDKQTREIQIESIGYIVCNHFGLDTSNFMFKNLISLSKNKNDKELADLLDTIQNKSAQIINDIEKVLVSDRRLENNEFTFDL